MISFLQPRCLSEAVCQCVQHGRGLYDIENDRNSKRFLCNVKHDEALKESPCLSIGLILWFIEREPLRSFLGYYKQTGC